MKVERRRESVEAPGFVLNFYLFLGQLLVRNSRSDIGKICINSKKIYEHRIHVCAKCPGVVLHRGNETGIENRL